MTLKICKLQSSHYRNVSLDPLGTAGGSLATDGAHFGSRCVIPPTFPQFPFSVSYRPISTDCPEPCGVLTFLRGCSWGFLSSRIRYSVAERVVTDVSKRRGPSTEWHSITPHKTIPLTDFFPSHPRYRYSPTLIRSVKMPTAAPLQPRIQITIPAG